MIGVILPIAAIIFLVAINGLFVAAEFALVGARVSRLESLANNGSGAAKWLLEVFNRHAGKDSYIAVAQLGITLASIGLGMYGEPAVAHWLYEPLEDTFGLSETASHTVGFLIALSAITYLHVVFGEMIPKAMALQAPESVSVKLNPLMRGFSILFRPMVTVLNAIAFALMRMMRIPEPDKKLKLHTSNELSIVTAESAESGQLGSLQRDLIRNIFELESQRAEEIMISRSHIVAIDKAATADEVQQLIVSSPRSRYPITDGDLDHVVGLLHVKDFIRAIHRGQSTNLSELGRQLPAVAASTSAEDLLERFKAANTHAALVIDEFGATVGFVSLDDVIAEVMDEDEVDGIMTHEDGSITMPGETPLSDLREYLGDESFAHDDVVTIAGLLLADQGSVPDIGTSFMHGAYTASVAARDGRQITSVRLVALGVEDGPTGLHDQPSH